MISGGAILTETDKNKIKKLNKKYVFLKKAKHILLCCAIFMFFILLLEEFGVLDLPFYETGLPISLRVFLNTWIGIPIIIIEKTMKNIACRIREIESLNENKP